MSGVDLSRLDGLAWQPGGQATLSGGLLWGLQGLDARFVEWARALGATEYRFGTFLPARELHRLDYFRSFPHMVSFAAALDADPASLKAFAAGEVLDATGAVRLGRTAPVREVLTPAACYHFYVALQGRALDAPLDLTTVATCFRREEHYEPLQRQWNFTMREIVRLGTADEVKSFLEGFRERLDPLFRALGLDVRWEQATDPFFDPRHNPKFLAQKLDPVKTEMMFEGRLSIGSINFHRNFFGETFDIRRGGEAAFSGCVAFGLERWLYALLCRFGPETSSWPAELRGA